MVFAYPESFIPDAMKNLGEMYEVAVHHYNYDIDDFQNIFLDCGVADGFSAGSIDLICGMTGKELFNYVLWSAKLKQVKLDRKEVSNNTDEYLAGASIAKFQRLTGKTFQEIHKFLPMSYVCQFVSNLWNMDESIIFEKLSLEFFIKKYPGEDHDLINMYINCKRSFAANSSINLPDRSTQNISKLGDNRHNI